MTAFLQWLADQAAARDAAGLTRRLVEADRVGPDRVEPLLDLAGNDYLGLARDVRVVAAAAAAAHEYGAGATASRLVSGSLAVHSRLEEALAEFMGRSAP